MESYDIIITQLMHVKEDTIYKDKPYISRSPRPHTSIVYVKEGTLSYTVGSREYLTKSGSIFIALYGDTDISSSTGSLVKYIYYGFNTLDMPQLSPSSLDRVNNPANPQAYKNLFERSLEVWNSRVFGYFAQCREMLYSVINRLVNENYAKTETYYNYNKIRAAIQKIETCYSSEITVKSLSELCSMSEGNLTRLFREITGFTPSRYLCETRMRNARHLLSTGKFNISETAQQCGYSDVYSFSRAFRRLNGVPPSKYK